MALLKPEMFAGISSDDVFEVRNHMVFRNGKQIPFIPHDKRGGRAKIDPKFFVYHFSAGRPSLESLVSYMKASTTEADVHLCLNRGGQLVQMAPLNEKCWHAGSSAFGGYTSLNNHACGIEVINPGALEILGNGLYKTWYGEVYKHDPANGIIIGEAKHHLRGGPVVGWLHYSPEQISIVTSLAIAIHAAYNVTLVGHDEITTRKTDPGPFSQIDRMRAIISTDRSSDKEEETKAEETARRQAEHDQNFEANRGVVKPVKTGIMP